MDQFDLVVIGSGPGGYRAAVLGALRGLRVAIVERGEWGGCCLNRGCVPKKDWYRTACLLVGRERFAARGVSGDLTGDLAAAWRHQRQVVATVQASYRDYLARLRVRMVSGSARLAEGRRVIVRGADREEELVGAAIVLAVGGSPRLPSHVPLVPDRILTTDELFQRPPPAGRHVAIFGSGAVATELAFILDAFGLTVNWFGHRPPLARGRFSAPARTALQEALAARRLAPRLGPALPTPEPAAAGVVLRESGERVDWVLVATGRAPATAELRLPEAGIATTPAGFVEVDSALETRSPGVYAIGDCVGGPMTANQALADAGIVIDNIVDGGRRRERDLNATPEVIYSAMELARVGLSESEAEGAGLEPAIGYAAFATSPAALVREDARGFVRLVADLDDGKLLGGEVVGEDAGELIHLVAFGDRVTALNSLARGEFNHPARAEELQHAAETLAARWGLGATVLAPRRPSAR